jgi:hypothetical protein
LVQVALRLALQKINPRLAPQQHLLLEIIEDEVAERCDNRQDRMTAAIGVTRSGKK